MSKFMNREQIDPLEATIDICLAESKRVPVVFRGKLYYLYSVTSQTIEIVGINMIYDKVTEYTENHYNFLPRETLSLPWSQHQVEILQFVSICAKQNDLTHVDVKFAELQDHQMQILLLDQEFPLLATGRLYDFIEDHYEMHDYE